MLLWVTVSGFDAFMDDGCWYFCLSGLGLLVWMLFLIRVAGFTLFYIRVAVFDAFLD